MIPVYNGPVDPIPFVYMASFSCTWPLFRVHGLFFVYMASFSCTMASFSCRRIHGKRFVYTIVTLWVVL